MDENYYISLIYKELSEEISPSEQKELLTWKAASPNNQDTYRAVVEAWKVSDILNADVEDVDVAAAFDELAFLMEEDTPKEAKVVSMATAKKPAVERTIPSKKIQQPSSIPIWSIAASVLLVIGGMFLWSRSSSGELDSSKMILAQSGQEIKEVILPDGSKVFLNKNSELSYPEKFAAANRMVSLKGEAFFEVSHDKAHPFIVATGKETVTVLGTSFNVNTGLRDETTVYVSTGKVAVEQLDSQAKLVLTKGEKAISNTQSNTLVETSATDNDIAWRTKKLFFLNTPMLEVKTYLESYYGVKVVFENSKFGDCPLDNYSIEKQSIETALEDMSTILSFEVEEKNKYEYIIKGGQCE